MFQTSVGQCRQSKRRQSGNDDELPTHTSKKLTEIEFPIPSPRKPCPLGPTMEEVRWFKNEVPKSFKQTCMDDKDVHNKDGQTIGTKPQATKLDLTIEDLENDKRSKKAIAEDVDKLVAEKGLKMIEQSTYIVDKDGLPLLAYFSHKLQGRGGRKRSEGKKGMTVEHRFKVSPTNLPAIGILIRFVEELDGTF
jgi:hypothetical protein